MNSVPTASFTDPDRWARLNQAAAADLNSLDFGVIGLDAQAQVQRCNSFESKPPAHRRNGYWASRCSTSLRRA